MEGLTPVLHKSVVVGVAGKVEQAQPGIGGPQVGEVEVDQVVSYQEVRPSARSSSLAKAWATLRPTLGIASDGPISGRTTATAWIRLSALPTSRYRERQRVRAY